MTSTINTTKYIHTKELLYSRKKIFRNEQFKKQPHNSTRACLKIAFCKMCVTVCGKFVPKPGGVAGYAD
ncbi:MAG: DUF6783 domain-containing protein [Lacrimispora saccharolytica]